MKKRNIKIAIDTAMVILLPLLMAYSLIGERFHEIIGTMMLALFIVHHIMNRSWHKAIFKGKYPPERIFRTALDLLLFFFMVAQPVSGILLSKHLYTFLPALPVSTLARAVHMLLAYWGFILVCVHAGTHFDAPMTKLKKVSKPLRTAVRAVAAAISAYGCYAFIKRGFAGYLFGKTAFAFFDFSEPVIFFIVDYLSVMILFGSAGLLIITGFRRRRQKTA